MVDQTIDKITEIDAFYQQKMERCNQFSQQMDSLAAGGLALQGLASLSTQKNLVEEAARE